MASSSGVGGGVGGGGGGGGGGNSFDIPVLDVEKMYRSRSSKSSSEPDYIPYNKKGKEIFGRLAQNTGLFWLGGFAAAGGYGMYEGWQSAVNPSLKVRFNSVLNGLSRRGAKAGNALGVVAFVHTAIGGVLEQLEVEEYVERSSYLPMPQGSHVVVVPALQGLLTGALYKSMTGPRGATLAGVIGMFASVAYCVGGGYLYEVWFPTTRHRKGR